MSFPTIPQIAPTISFNRTEVVNLLLASVALEEPFSKIRCCCSLSLKKSLIFPRNKISTFSGYPALSVCRITQLFCQQFLTTISTFEYHIEMKTNTREGMY